MHALLRSNERHIDRPKHYRPLGAIRILPVRRRTEDVKKTSDAICLFNCRRPLVNLLRGRRNFGMPFNIHSACLPDIDRT